MGGAQRLEPHPREAQVPDVQQLEPHPRAKRVPMGIEKSAGTLLSPGGHWGSSSGLVLHTEYLE